MNKYNRLQYLEDFGLSNASVYSLFPPRKHFNQMASDAKLAWRADIFRVQKISFINDYRRDFQSSGKRLYSLQFNFKNKSLLL